MAAVLDISLKLFPIFTRAISPFRAQAQQRRCEPAWAADENGDAPTAAERAGHSS
jgi:hypothetical protein